MTERHRKRLTKGNRPREGTERSTLVLMTAPRVLRPWPPFIDRSGCRLLPISSASLFPPYSRRKRSWPPPSRRPKTLRVAFSTFPTCRKHMPSLLDPSFMWPVPCSRRAAWRTGKGAYRCGVRVYLDADATRQLLITTHPDVHRAIVCERTDNR